MAILNPNLKGFFETKGIRNYVLYGGRASSKTYHTAGFCIFLAINYRIKFLCVRSFQARIADSVKAVLEECIYQAGLEGHFVITENAIECPSTGSTFSFLGIQRNLREIKGTANVDVLWVEEAEDLSAEQWKVLEPTIREEGSRIFIVFNPRYATDFVYKRFVSDPPANTLVRKINYDENPYLSATMREIIDRAQEEDYDLYSHIYLGEPMENDDAVVIKRSWIMAAIDAHITLGLPVEGSKRVGFDVADSGEDKCATVYTHGWLVSDADMWKANEDELLKSCTRAYDFARSRGASIGYDSIGVGASAGAKFGEINDGKPVSQQIQYSKFNAGAGVSKPEAYYTQQTKNKDMFANLKAQTWWALADRFRNTYNAVRNGQEFDTDELISISSDLPNLSLLIDELSTPKRDYDNNGRVKVESKKDLAKRGIPSHNLADCVAICFGPESIAPSVGVLLPKVRMHASV